MSRISITEAFKRVPSKFEATPEYYKAMSEELIKELEDCSNVRDRLIDLYIEAYTDSSGELPDDNGWLDNQISIAYRMMDDIKRLNEQEVITYNEILSHVILGLPDNIITETLFLIAVSFIATYLILGPAERKRLENYAFHDLIKEVMK